MFVVGSPAHHGVFDPSACTSPSPCSRRRTWGERPKIPLDKLATRSGELDKAKPVVTYCAGTDCHASREAAERLATMGFKVRAYEGGIKEWKAANLPVEP